MNQIILEAGNGKYVVSKIVNGQKGLYAEGNSQKEAIVLEVLRIGGFITDEPLRIEFKTGYEYLTIHNSSDGPSVVLDGSGSVENRPFEVLWLGGSQIAMKGANNHFIAAAEFIEGNTKNKLFANLQKVDNRGIFTVIEVEQ